MDFVSLQRSTDSGRQAEASLEVGHGAKQNVKFLRGDEKTRFDFGEAPTISALNICRFCSGAVLGLSPICDQCGLCKLWFLMLEGLNRQFSRSIPAWWQVLAETYTNLLCDALHWRTLWPHSAGFSRELAPWSIQEEHRRFVCCSGL